MPYESVTIDISKAKSNRDVDKLLDSSLKKGFDVKTMTKDYVILTKQTSR